MQKRVIFFVVLLLFLLPFVFSASIDSEIQKITHYAEEYETGNINYVQLQIYLGSGRQKLNEILGATGMEHGGTFKQGQLKSFLGEPTGETRWVWFEREQREKRIDSSVPTWEKIIFDGKKIQIKLNAYPFLAGKEGELVYDLNFQSNFKRPEEQLDISGKIGEIKTLAEIFNADSTTENARALAKESVNAERTFESYFRQSGEKCEDIMKSIFGTENIRETQQMLVEEITFYVGENFEVKARLEMCDECEWNWINLDFWMEGRGPGFKPPKETPERISPEEFKGKDSEYFKTEIARITDEIKQALEQGDYKKVFSYKSRIWALNEAWNRVSNEVWQQVDEIFKEERRSMAPEKESVCSEGICEAEAIQTTQPEEFDWKAFDNKRREKEMELRKENYEERKQFYLNLFSEYDKKEISFTQVEYEKRLIEEFIEFGEEICTNNVDDNKNELVDCLDSLCAGKICGTKEVEVASGMENETHKEMRDLFCIQEMCQLPEEVVKEKAMICGNHVCEGNETIETCAEDCSVCPQHEALNCSGRVIFKGQDENNCPLEPICVEETTFCQINEDCIQPLCGTSECVEGQCKFIELSECREAECVDGDERIANCAEEQIIVEMCIEGSWIETGAECEIGEPTTPEEISEELIANECSVREDCGNAQDVCSNGRCITIPEAIQVEPEVPTILEELQPPAEQEQSQEEIPEEVPEETPTEGGETPTTGEVIFFFFRGLLGRITGAITGFQTEGEQPPPETTPEIIEPPITEPTPEQPIEPVPGECADIERGCGGVCPPCPKEQPPEGPVEHIEEEGPEEEREGKWEEKPREEFEEGEKIEKEGKFEEKPMPEEPEHPPQEKGVFKAGGVCRTSLQRTEGFIFFDGWGEPFEEVRQYKPEFYEGGQADWCQFEFEDLIQQRKEFENSFNEQFVKWFFESYLANSAEDWEQSVSGIFELYWKNIDVIIRTTHVMKCLEKQGMAEYTPISLIKYDTELGSLEFWEEVKTAKIPGMDESMEVISPYMKIWVFPNKEFIQYEMKQAMKEHEFPGPSEEKMERKNEEGITEEEREMIKQDEKFMEMVREIANKYGGNVDIAIQFKDFATGEIVFNLYAQINENDILKLEPMLPEEVPEKDITIDVDFEKVYDFIYFSEKQMRGAEEQFPPWDKKPFGGRPIRKMVDGVRMSLKVRAIVNSAQVSPESARADAMDLFKTFFKMRSQAEEKEGMPGEGEQGEGGEEIEEILGSKEEITGEIIRK